MWNNANYRYCGYRGLRLLLWPYYPSMMRLSYMNMHFDMIHKDTIEFIYLPRSNSFAGHDVQLQFVPLAENFHSNGVTIFRFPRFYSYAMPTFPSSPPPPFPPLSLLHLLSIFHVHFVLPPLLSSCKNSS